MRAQLYAIMNSCPDILKIIQQKSGVSLSSPRVTSVSGGSINACYLLGEGEQQIFLKTNRKDRLSMFKAEGVGLKTLSGTRTLRVPKVLCTGISGNKSFIAMQAIQFGDEKAFSYRDFAQQLAAMHHHHKPWFGATLDNTIGSIAQRNSRTNNWFEFWREQRLGFQLKLARKNHAPVKLIEDGYRLNDSFERLFDKAPAAACLHGDLWRGNWGFGMDGEPIIFDPAHYFGDRETDIAMTTLFGGAPPEFYAAYIEAYPLNSGYAVRETFYNIYHVLNHYNLFGGAYAGQAHNMIRSVLSELG